MRSKPPDSASRDRSEPPIFPAPMTPMVFKLELVEERALGEALALLGGHLHVAGRQEEDAVRDRLDVAVRADLFQEDVWHLDTSKLSAEPTLHDDFPCDAPLENGCILKRRMLDGRPS